jgi:CBS domain-containing protein
VKVKKVMNSKVNSCGRDTDLVTAAQAMLQNECGALPVLDSGKVVGIITDRDICLALAAKGQSASSTTVDQIMSTDVYQCFPNDNLKSALKTMRQKRVRRLPVTDPEGTLEGILSITDVALKAGKNNGKGRSPSFRSVLRAYRGICERQSWGQESEESRQS